MFWLKPRQSHAFPLSIIRNAFIADAFFLIIDPQAILHVCPILKHEVSNTPKSSFTETKQVRKCVWYSPPLVGIMSNPFQSDLALFEWTPTQYIPICVCPRVTQYKGPCRPFFGCKSMLEKDCGAWEALLTSYFLKPDFRILQYFQYHVQDCKPWMDNKQYNFLKLTTVKYCFPTARLWSSLSFIRWCGSLLYSRTSSCSYCWYEASRCPDLSQASSTISRQNGTDYSILR